MSIIDSSGVGMTVRGRGAGTADVFFSGGMGCAGELGPVFRGGRTAILHRTSHLPSLTRIHPSVKQERGKAE